MTDHNACKELGCKRLEEWTLLECEEAKCCWHYVRHREEIRQEQQRRDVEAKG